MKQKKNLRQIFSVFLTCMMIIGVALANDHIFVEGEGKPQAEQQVQEGEPQQGQEQEQEQQEPGQEQEQEREQGDPGKPGEPGEQKPGQGQGEIQEGKPQQEPEQGQEPGQQEQGQGDSGKPGELPGKPEEVKQRGEPKNLISVEISSITLTEVNGLTVSECGYWNTYRFNMEFDATRYGKTLKAGDYFEVTLPKEFKFLKEGAENDIELKTPEDEVCAKAHITPNELGGGTLRVTFTNYVEEKPDITCKFYTDVTFAHNHIDKNGGNYTITASVKGGNSEKSVNIKVKPKPGIVNEYFTKWGHTMIGSDVQWRFRINHNKGHYSNLVISDELFVNSGNLPSKIKYIPETFLLQEVEYDEYGGTGGKVNKQYSYDDMKKHITFSDDNRKFEFRFKDMLGNTDGKQYLFIYNTTYIPGLKLRNKGTFQSDQKTKEVKAYFQNTQSGGVGQSDLRGRIIIIKQDADNNSILLPGAEFLVTNVSNNQTFTLTTNQNGEAVSDKLTPGKYKVKETKAPSDEYLLDETEREVDVADDEPVFLLLGNKKAVTIKAEKVWVDNGFTGVKKEVFFRLLGDGNPVGTTKVVSPTNEVEWKVPKYNNNNKEIKYTVEEVDQSGAPWKEQNWTTSGPVKDKNSGKFIITNTYNSPNPGGGGSGGGQSGGGSGGTGGDDSNKPKPNDPKPSDDSTGMGGATPPDSSVMPDGSVVPNDSTTATNTVAPKNHKTPKILY
ncbi:Ig-like domain-containing protein [Filifactor alocis]